MDHRHFEGRPGAALFCDYQAFQRIWTHPYVLRSHAIKIAEEDEKKGLEASDSEGSLKDFIDDSVASERNAASSSDSDDNSDYQNKSKRLTRAARKNSQSNILLKKIKKKIKNGLQF